MFCHHDADSQQQPAGSSTLVGGGVELLTRDPATLAKPADWSRGHSLQADHFTTRVQPAQSAPNLKVPYLGTSLVVASNAVSQHRPLCSGAT